MGLPFKKYGYKLNPLTNNYDTPQVFLVNKKLKKIGELKNVDDFSISINEVNQADDLSFTYYKQLNNIDCPYFHLLDNLCVIYIEEYGYFEIAVNTNEESYTKKDVSGISLGRAELSQIRATLEINTEDDMSRTYYDVNYPTIFYRMVGTLESDDIKKKKKESSLLDRILTYAPHFRIGYVSPTLLNIQRTFSWQSTDIESILNDIAEEVGCAFVVDVYVDGAGNAVREINAYDMEYCTHCWEESQKQYDTNVSKFRNIVNGICQNCNSSANVVSEISEDTNIFISTDNITDEISLECDKDGIKNCFEISGGDDMISNTVQGLLLSGDNKIISFSDDQKKMMSQELRSKLDQYTSDYKNNEQAYRDLLETSYNMYDIILYLQSGKMPLLEEDVTTTDNALYVALNKIKQYFNNTFYVQNFETYKSYTSSTCKTSILNMFTTYVPKGYSVFVTNDDANIVKTTSYSSSTQYKWYGTIKVYSTGNRDDYYILHVTPSEVYITYGKSNARYTYGDTTKDNLVRSFSAVFDFGEQNQNNYMKYIEQYISDILSENDLDYENQKMRNWNEYSYNLLESYHDGFTRCIEILDELNRTSEPGSIAANAISTMRSGYVTHLNNISKQMLILRDQIFALKSYLGDFSDGDSSMYLDSSGGVSYSLSYYSNFRTLFQNMLDSSKAGGYSGSSFTCGEFIGTKPFKCLKCNSSNVSPTSSGNVCNNCGNTDSNTIYTYYNIMQDIVSAYANDSSQYTKTPDTIMSQRKAIQDHFNLKAYFNDDSLFNEFCSFLREDSYDNSNYISDGLSNSEIIQHSMELVNKAKQELAKACIPKYTISAPLSSIVAQKSYIYNGVVMNDDYSKFMINNKVRAKINDQIYVLRIASIKFNYPIQNKIEVSFTNARKLENGMLDDIKDALSNAASMSTSYDYYASQAEKGSEANSQFEVLKREGLNAGLMAVKAGIDQDVLIDDHGILLRRKNHDTGEYSPYQMKLIDRNIVMTDDAFQSARLAIGLGTYEGQTLYGVWCDLLLGDLLVGKKLKIMNESGSVTITGDQIILDGTKIVWEKPTPMDGVQDLVNFKNHVNGALTGSPTTEIGEDYVISPKIGGGYLYIKDIRQSGNTGTSIEINPTGTSFSGHNDSYVFSVQKDGQVVMGVTNGGTGYFSGTVYASGGSFSGTVYATDGVFNGTVNATDGVFNGTVYATNGTFNGTVNASAGTFHGRIEADEGYFKGTIEASDGKIGGWSISSEGLIKTDTGGLCWVKPGDIMFSNIHITNNGIDIGTDILSVNSNGLTCHKIKCGGFSVDNSSDTSTVECNGNLTVQGYSYLYGGLDTGDCDIICGDGDVYCHTLYCDVIDSGAEIHASQIIYAESKSVYGKISELSNAIDQLWTAVHLLQ